jgi:hypothetical protein
MATVKSGRRQLSPAFRLHHEQPRASPPGQVEQQVQRLQQRRVGPPRPRFQRRADGGKRLGWDLGLTRIRRRQDGRSTATNSPRGAVCWPGRCSPGGVVGDPANARPNQVLTVTVPAAISSPRIMRPATCGGVLHLRPHARCAQVDLGRNAGGAVSRRQRNSGHQVWRR